MTHLRAVCKAEIRRSGADAGQHRTKTRPTEPSADVTTEWHVIELLVANWQDDAGLRRFFRARLSSCSPGGPIKSPPSDALRDHLSRSTANEHPNRGGRAEGRHRRFRPRGGAASETTTLLSGDERSRMALHKRWGRCAIVRKPHQKIAVNDVPWGSGMHSPHRAGKLV